MAAQKLNFVIAAVDKTQKIFLGVAAGLARVKKAVVSVQGALVALGAAAALKMFADKIDDLAKASSRLGLTVNELQSLQFAASQTGASAEELEKGLTRFNRSISEASTGIGTGLRSFEALGIKVMDAAGNLRPTNELLNEVSDRLQTIEAPADRVRIAFDLFGRSGVNLVNTLQNGSEELKNLREEFNAFTLELTQDQANAVEEANDRFDRLGQTLSSIGNRLTSFFLPKLAAVADFLTTGFLKVLVFVTSGLRDFLNMIVEIGKEVGVEMEKFTFGEQLEKDLKIVIFNSENAGKAVMDANGQIRHLIGNARETKKPLDVMAQGFERVKEAVGMTTGKIRESTSSLTEYTKAAQDVTKNLQDAATRGVKSLEDSLVGVIEGTMSAKDAFKSMARSIISDLIRIQIQQNITSKVSSFLSGLNLFGAGATSAGVPPWVSGLPARANGGRVTAGQPHLVGEKGAELFVPSGHGKIVPNGGGAGGSVVVNQTINLSAGVSQTVRAEVMQMMPQIQEASKAAVLDARRRGGSFSAAFG